MADEPGPQIYRPTWTSGCKRCGGGGGGDDPPMRKLVLLGVVALLSPGLMLMTSGWLAARGLRITGVDCAWSPGTRAYLATVHVQNTEEVFKEVSVRVQGRFRPVEGQRWPDAETRTHYGAISQELRFAVGPRQALGQQAHFTVPGAEGFRCEAKVWLGRQQRAGSRD